MNIVERPDIANNIHATTLVGAGLTSFFLNEKRPKTALIAPAVGGALLFMSPALKSGNKSVAHVAVSLTSVLAAVTGQMLTKELWPKKEAGSTFPKAVHNRRAAIFGTMTLTGLAAVGVYVAGFIAKRKSQKAS
ncbi:hypothetical protein LN893_16795 [Pontibacter sp. XAAS-A31]|nr:hypothetical protein [Pontibacter harenae]